MAGSKDTSEKKKIQDQKKKLKQDQKQQKKEARVRAKEIAAQEAALSDDEEGGGFFTFLATLAIIAIWVAIVCVVIKLDVGGFGSNVLTPILKDVPVVKKILPNPKTETDQQQPTDDGGYTSLSDAVDQIKKLELQLQQAQSESAAKDEEIANLKAETVRLKEFEDKQVEFQRLKTEFFENVVYAEKGPGAEEYKKYYEAMDPATAEYLYKQVVAQLEEDGQITEYAATYSSMKPKQAAAIFEKMTDNLTLVAKILNAMDTDSRGAILGAMNADVAAKLTKIMDPES